MKKETSEYKNIFKSTFLFGFVQIFNILTKVLLNKATAVFFRFGISQSAVRNISKANNNDKVKDIYI